MALMKRSLVGADDLARHLGIKTQTVYLWVRQKRIPFYRVGRLVKFDLDEVLEHFKVEVERDEGGTEGKAKRSPTFVGRPIDPFRVLRKLIHLLQPSNVNDVNAMKIC